LVGLGMGLLYLIVTPPFQVPDEPNHFYRAYQVSEGQVLSVKTADNQCGGDIPRSVVLTVQDLYKDENAEPGTKIHPADIIGETERHLARGRVYFAHFPNTALYCPLPYGPQLIGIELAKLLNLAPILIFYLGRLTNLLTAVLICAYAIRITPVFGNVLFLIASTPMFIYEAASVSPDALTNSLSILLTAVILKFAFGREAPVRKPDLLLMAIISAALGLCKNVYCVLPLLYFMIPRQRVGSRLKYLIAGVSIFLSGALTSLIWARAIRSIYVPYRGPATFDEPLQFIFAHPFIFAKMVVASLLGHFVFYAGSFVGYLGWSDISLPAPFIVFYLLVLVGVALHLGDQSIEVSRRNKLISAGVAILGSILVVVGQFFIGTPTGSASIDKSQGRYFIPLAALYFILFYNKKLTGRISRTLLNRFVCVFGVASLLFALWFVVRRYYDL
jgi:uncharacterized membrane protein